MSRERARIGRAWPCRRAGFRLLAAAGSASAAPTETVLHSFTGGSSDGAGPVAGLIGNSSGNLYGTTCLGGKAGKGVVLKLSDDARIKLKHLYPTV